MAMTMQQISPVAHVPVGLGGVRTRTGAARIATCGPPHPAHVLACGRGVEARLLARRDGHQALEKGGTRREERGLFPVRQPGLTRAALHADRRGPSRDTLCAAPLNRGFGALARTALAVYAVAPPWLPQETTTLTL